MPRGPYRRPQAVRPRHQWRPQGAGRPAPDSVQCPQRQLCRRIHPNNRLSTQQIGNACRQARFVPRHLLSWHKHERVQRHERRNQHNPHLGQCRHRPMRYLPRRIGHQPALAGQPQDPRQLGAGLFPGKHAQPAAGTGLQLYLRPQPGLHGLPQQPFVHAC